MGKWFAIAIIVDFLLFASVAVVPNFFAPILVGYNLGLSLGAVVGMEIIKETMNKKEVTK